jgi:hypothetical protein
LPARFRGHDHSTGAHQLFHVAVAETPVEVQPEALADDVDGKTLMLVRMG